MAVSDTVLEDLNPLPYERIRAMVQDGDLLLCQGRDPFSRLIQWGTRSPWSHVGMAFRIPTLNRIIVVESVQTLGVRAVALSDFCSRDSSGNTPYPGRIVLARHGGLASEDSRARAAARFAFDHLGCRYAPGEITRIALRIAANRLWGARGMPRMLLPDAEFICSEFVARALHIAEVKVPWDGLGFIAPADFARDPHVEAIAQLDVSAPPRFRKAGARRRQALASTSGIDL